MPELPPLADRMRPLSIDEVAGQSHLLASGKPLCRIIDGGSIPSMILWGPPGVGKTTIARIIASGLGLPFFSLSAINAGVKEVREVIAKAEDAGNAILFLDEIHRFSKSQQDSLLASVETGTLRLIGATTENPSFEVIRPLLSRSQVYLLEELSKDDLVAILERAISTDVILKKLTIELREVDALLVYSGGDARKMLNLFELVLKAANSDRVVVTNELVAEIASTRMAVYDKAGEQHYDIISAFIKSIRGSDPNAAIFWLARMIEGGEDPSFIARRMLILASEDIGLANPTALVLANSCFQAVNVIGYPECDLILAECTLYLATSPKSNSVYTTIRSAKQKIRSSKETGVPLHLRNAPTKLMKELNYGREYQYSHDYEGNFSKQEFLPDELSGYQFYTPASNDREESIRNWLRSRWKEKYRY